MANTIESPLHLMIAGAPKAGTTSLYHYLENHPEVGASRWKNTHYFTDPDFNYLGREMAVDAAKEKGFNCYRDYFHPEPSALYMEATATYFASLGTPQRIRDNLEKVKFIFMLRDPAERLASACRVHVAAQMVPADTSLADYVAMQYHSMEEMRLSITQQALMTGHYAANLKRFYDVFESEDILLLPFTDLKKPHEMMGKVCEFLEIDSHFYEGYNFERTNESHSMRNTKVHFGLRGALQKVKQNPIVQIPLIKKTGRTLLNKVLKPLYQKSMYQKDPLKGQEEAMGKLREYYSGEADALYELTGQRGLID